MRLYPAVDSFVPGERRRVPEALVANIAVVRRFAGVDHLVPGEIGFGLVGFRAERAYVGPLDGVDEFFVLFVRVVVGEGFLAFVAGEDFIAEVLLAVYSEVVDGSDFFVALVAFVRSFFGSAAVEVFDVRLGLDGAVGLQQKR